ncbi:MAG: hypothetical protein KJO18_00430 [Acidimicrobiia bacterium]|nr:hypothetical protein [Acidimicrobiia bacterium]
MKRFWTYSIAVALVVAGCGGDAANDGPVDDAPSATTELVTTQPPQGETNSDTTIAPAGDDSDASGPSSATVTVGDQTYHFSSEGAVVAQCLTDFFGVFSVQLLRVDESGASADGGVRIVALHEGTDPAVVDEVNSIEVSVDDEDWIADEADSIFTASDLLEPGMSQVDSVEIDGRTVRGTATFVRENSVYAGDVETATGTFEATCGEERTS